MAITVLENNSAIAPPVPRSRQVCTGASPTGACWFRSSPCCPSWMAPQKLQLETAPSKHSSLPCRVPSFTFPHVWLPCACPRTPLGFVLLSLCQPGAQVLTPPLPGYLPGSLFGPPDRTLSHAPRHLPSQISPERVIFPVQ